MPIVRIEVQENGDRYAGLVVVSRETQYAGRYLVLGRSEEAVRAAALEIVSTIAAKGPKPMLRTQLDE